MYTFSIIIRLQIDLKSSVATERNKICCKPETLFSANMRKWSWWIRVCNYREENGRLLLGENKQLPLCVELAIPCSK